MKRFFTLSSRSCLPIIAKFTFDAATETCVPYICCGLQQACYNLYDSEAECSTKCSPRQNAKISSPVPKGGPSYK